MVTRVEISGDRAVERNESNVADEGHARVFLKFALEAFILNFVVSAQRSGFELEIDRHFHSDTSGKPGASSLSGRPNG